MIPRLVLTENHGGKHFLIFIMITLYPSKDSNVEKRTEVMPPSFISKIKLLLYQMSLCGDKRLGLNECNQIDCIQTLFHTCVSNCIRAGSILPNNLE